MARESVQHHQACRSGTNCDLHAAHPCNNLVGQLACLTKAASAEGLICERGAACLAQPLHFGGELLLCDLVSGFSI